MLDAQREQRTGADDPPLDSHGSFPRDEDARAWSAVVEPKAEDSGNEVSPAPSEEGSEPRKDNEKAPKAKVAPTFKNSILGGDAELMNNESWLQIPLDDPKVKFAVWPRHSKPPAVLN